MKAFIGTKNGAKIEGARRALTKYFDDVEIEGISVESEVSEQPVNSETLEGCRNRIKNLKLYCKENGIEADLYLAIESGMQNMFENWMITNIAIIEDNNGFQSVSTSPSFPLPQKYVETTKENGFSETMNTFFTRDEERRNKEGGIALLTHGEITRIDLTEEAFIMALTTYINGNEWK